MKNVMYSLQKEGLCLIVFFLEATHGQYHITDT